MSTIIASPAPSEAALVELATAIRGRHRGRLAALQLTVEAEGVILDGTAVNFYGKQLALHEVRHVAGLAVRANRITVTCS